MSKILIGILIIVVLLGGGYFAYTYYLSQPAPAPEQMNQQPATTSATTTPPQVQAHEVTVGTGDEAKVGTIVSVLYTGYLGAISSSTVFDSSDMHKNPKTGAPIPLRFIIGTDKLIVGFQVGVNGMKVGGERLIAIPPALGYGNQDVRDPSGKVIIPGNTTLIFDLKLIKVEQATSTGVVAPNPAKAK